MVMPINYSCPNITSPPKRVVSLVPSITESLFDLGIGHTLVGITDYCIYPESSVSNVPRVGGPKNPDLHHILALNPDLVLANKEENNKNTVYKIIAYGIPVWLTFPINVTQTIDMLRMFIDLFHCPEAIYRVISIETSLEWLRIAKEMEPEKRYFCPLWRGVYQKRHIWWMTFNQETYMHDLLFQFGGDNIFKNRKRRYPLAADLGMAKPNDLFDGDKRYPRVTKDEIVCFNPEIIFLPSEPYNFDEESTMEICNLLSNTDAVKNQHVYQIDGSLLTWCGTRIGKAINQLPFYFQKSS